MIKRISANHSSFKTVEFTAGLNVIWADRTKESTKKDSRNGLGKSTLIEIIHFCLGAKASTGKGLLVNALKGWHFSLTMQLGEQEITVTRTVDHPGKVYVDVDTDSSPRRTEYTVKEWNTIAGNYAFGLGFSNDEHKYHPSFRSLISYFIRRGKDAFSTPFEHHRKQLEWDKQIHNAFLLGLAWEDAAGLQILKDRKKGLEEFKKAVKSGVVKGLTGTLGDLEAQKIRLKVKLERESAEFQSFRVHPQYTEIQASANQLTGQIHEFVNANTIEKRMLDLYENSLVEEAPPPINSIELLYEDSGITLPGVALRKLEEVRSFHKTIIENRRAFINTEIERLRREIKSRDQLINDALEKRISLMEILRTHGALEEYTLLQSRHLNTVNDLNSVSTMIENRKAFEGGLIDIKIAQEELQKKARQDYDERSTLWARAIELFNTYSELLYNAPGKLVIDIGPTGFQFDVEIERSGSSGISNMKVFCYDLTLAKLWANKNPSPRILVHDSTIFDGVDERQRALALETAAKESEQSGYQYICTLNSDYIPWGEFSPGFELKKYIRLQLTDRSIDGCLLGVRF